MSWCVARRSLADPMPAFIDEIGNRHGRLVVVAGPVRSASGTKWVCRCDCGREATVFSFMLRQGRTTSCGCLTKIDHVGERYGRLIVIAREPGRRVRCRCDCGAEATFRITHLRSGRTRSCGCLRREAAMQAWTFHGHAQRTESSPEYRTWQRMWERCTNKKAYGYRWYGARGISVCDDWRDFENFLRDMGRRPEGRSIDRIDCNGNYTPQNCRWATVTEQARNKRNTVRMPDVAIIVLERRQDGVSVNAIANEVGVSTSVVRQMINGTHWSVRA